MQAASNDYKQMMKAPLRNHSYIRVTIGLINQQAQSSAYVPMPNQYTYYSDLVKPMDNYQVQELYAACDQDYTTVDGSMYFLPKGAADVVLNQGIVTEALLGAIEIRFPIQYDIKGLTVEFGKAYPVDFSVISDNNTVEVKGHGAGHYVTEEIFEAATFLRFVPTAMVNGKGRFRINQITMGIGIYFDNRTILSATKREHISPIMEELPAIDFDLTINNKDRAYDIENEESTVNFLEPGQNVEVLYGQELDDGSVEWMPGASLSLKEWSADDESMHFSAADRFESMDGTYRKGLYRANGITLHDLATDVFKDAGVDARTYWLDPYLRAVHVNNPMPVVTHKEALQLIANAGRCILYQDREGSIFVKSSFVPDMKASSSSEAYYSHAPAVLDRTAKAAYASPGQDYADVQPTQYFLPAAVIRYSANSDGSGMTDRKQPDSKYIGIGHMPMAIHAHPNLFYGTADFRLDPSRTTGFLNQRDKWTIAQDSGSTEYTAHCRDTGQTTNVIKSLYANYIANVKQSDIFTLTLELMTPSFADWNGGVADTAHPFVIELYDVSKSRVGYYDVRVDDPGNILEPPLPIVNSRWHTLTRVINLGVHPFSWGAGKGWSDVQYLGIRLTLMRNGEVHYRHVKLSRGDKPSSWTPAPADWLSDPGNYSWELYKNPYLNTGYISEQVAGADGAFNTNPTVEITLEAAYKCFGMTLEFGRNNPQEMVFHAFYNGSLQEDYTVSGLTATTVIGHEFPEFDRLVLEFTKGAPNNRVLLDNIIFGDSTDYELSYGHELTKTPNGTQLSKARELQVSRTLYNQSSELKELTKETIAVTAADNRYTFYFANPSYDLVCTLTEPQAGQGAAIVESSNYYATVEITGTTGPVEVIISGREYVVTRAVVSRQLNLTGSLEAWENPLVSDTVHAANLADWVGDYLRSDRDYDLQYRGEPRIDANDIAFLENKYVPDLLLRIYDHTLKFNGGLSGTIKARRDMSHVATAKNRLEGQ